MTEPDEVFVPAVVGREALDLVGLVEWDSLQHAYADPEHIAGTKQRGTSLCNHPKRALEKLGAADKEAFAMAVNALYDSLCHQGGTIFEATSYAVPFLAAFLAGPDISSARAKAVGDLVACIGMVSCFVSDRGHHLGAFGPGVGLRTREALRSSRVHLTAAQARHRSLRKIFAMLEQILAHEPPDPAAASRLEKHFS